MSIQAVFLADQEITLNLFSRVKKQRRRDKRLPGKHPSPGLYRFSNPDYPWGMYFMKSNLPMPLGTTLGSYGALELLLEKNVSDVISNGNSFTRWWISELNEYSTSANVSSRDVLFSTRTASSPIQAIQFALDELGVRSNEPFLVFSGDAPLQRVTDTYLVDDVSVKVRLPSLQETYGLLASHNNLLYPRTYQFALSTNGEFHYVKEPNRALFRNDADLFSFLETVSEDRKGNNLFFSTYKVLTACARRSSDKQSFYRQVNKFIPHILEGFGLSYFGRLPKKPARVDSVLDVLASIGVLGIDVSFSDDLRDVMDMDTLGDYVTLYSLLDKHPTLYPHHEKLRELSKRFEDARFHPEYVSHSDVNSYARILGGTSLFHKQEVTEEALQVYAGCTYDDIDALAERLRTVELAQ